MEYQSRHPHLFLLSFTIKINYLSLKYSLFSFSFFNPCSMRDGKITRIPIKQVVPRIVFVSENALFNQRTKPINPKPTSVPCNRSIETILVLPLTEIVLNRIIFLKEKSGKKRNFGMGCPSKPLSRLPHHIITRTNI